MDGVQRVTILFATFCVCEAALGWFVANEASCEAPKQQPKATTITTVKKPHHGL